MMLKGARINAEWMTPDARRHRAKDRERLLVALLEPVEVDDEDRALAATLMAQKIARGYRRRAGPAIARAARSPRRC
jgi:ATP-dependent RNA helicase DeaD